MRSEVRQAIVAFLLTVAAIGLLAATDAHGAQPPTVPPAPEPAPVPRAYAEPQVVVVDGSPLVQPCF